MFALAVGIRVQHLLQKYLEEEEVEDSFYGKSGVVMFYGVCV